MMGKITKIWIIVAASLVTLGIIIFVLAGCFLDWDFTKFGTGEYETNTYEVNEEFNNISIKTDTAEIVFSPSDDEKCKVICYEEENVKHSVSVEDGVLTVKVVDTRKWYEHIGFNLDSMKITLNMPKGEYGALSVDSDTGDVKIAKDFKFTSIDITEDTGEVLNYASVTEFIKIKTATGHINVENISAGSLDLDASTGKVTVTDVTCEGDIKVGVSTGKTYLTNIVCKNVISNGATGDIFLRNVIAKNKFSIERNTGDVKFDSCDAVEIVVETDTGDVEGSLLTDKVFITKTDTGNINVPNSITGGRCEITTDTGDIKLEIKK